MHPTLDPSAATPSEANIKPGSPKMPALTFNITHAVHPIVGLDFAFGGTPELNTAASADSWPRVLTFLRSAF
jgi:hypothetical protein